MFADSLLEGLDLLQSDIVLRFAKIDIGAGVGAFGGNGQMERPTGPIWRSRRRSNGIVATPSCEQCGQQAQSNDLQDFNVCIATVPLRSSFPHPTQAPRSIWIIERQMT